MKKAMTKGIQKMRKEEGKMKKISCLVFAIFLVIMFADIALAKKKNKNKKCKVQNVMIEQKYHHLGDDNIDSWIVPEPEGTLWETTFRIKKSTLNKCQISFVKFLCHDLNDADLIVNGERITLHEVVNFSNQYLEIYAVPLPLDFLYHGDNIIGIEVKELNDGNYDDMEFGELEIWFQ